MSAAPASSLPPYWKVLGQKNKALKLQDLYPSRLPLAWASNQDTADEPKN